MRESFTLRAPIVITLPYFFYGEAVILRSLWTAGAEIIHIRKPDATEDELDRLICELQSLGCDMSCFTLHYNTRLAETYSLGGIHLQGEELLHIDQSINKRLSFSAHSWDEVRKYADVADYCFFSPLFNSVSKEGYKGQNLNPDTIHDELETVPYCSVVGLSGITSHNIWKVRTLGFDGAAAIGSVWGPSAKTALTPYLSETLTRFRALRIKWQGAVNGKLQLISNGDIDVAENFLAGGGRWIQLRMKDVPKEQIEEQGHEMRILCRQYGATLIVDDDPYIAKNIGAEGVHLGKNDMSPTEARKIVGDDAIIGATANTFDDIKNLSLQPIDYIGLGPYRFTTTKKNLSPILGLEGYQNIIKEMRLAGIDIPVVAIGGITVEDIPSIINTGVYGIAASGAISGADDVKQETEKFLSHIK